MRVFVAYPAREYFLPLMLQLQQQNKFLTGIRWTNPDNLHLTVYFIGEIENKLLPEIIYDLKNHFRNQNAFELQFDKTELRGKKKHPSMIWGKFNKNEIFSQLNYSINNEMKKFTSHISEHTDPIPHITLARINKSSLPNEINLNFSIVPELPEITYAELWQTIQEKGGVKYESLERFIFKSGLET